MVPCPEEGARIYKPDVLCRIGNEWGARVLTKLRFESSVACLRPHLSSPSEFLDAQRKIAHSLAASDVMARRRNPRYGPHSLTLAAPSAGITAGSGVGGPLRLGQPRELELGRRPFHQPGHLNGSSAGNDRVMSLTSNVEVKKLLSQSMLTRMPAGRPRSRINARCRDAVCRGHCGPSEEHLPPPSHEPPLPSDGPHYHIIASSPTRVIDSLFGPDVVCAASPVVATQSMDRHLRGTLRSDPGRDPQA